MKRSFKNHNFIKDNSGSTLITVIVAVGFVTILTAIILSTSLLSMQMKGIDRRAKDDFYYAEKALNDIYTKIGQAVQIQAASAYEEALVSVGRQVRDKSESGAAEIVEFKLSDDAQNYYKRKFVKNIEKWINDNKDQLDGAIVDGTKMDYEVSVNAGASSVIVKELYDITKGDSDPLNISALRVKDVKVTALDKNKNSQAVVVSDIVISIPDMNFFGTNADVLEYCIIANDGLTVEDKGDVTINGNLYSGINEYSGTKDKSGINVKHGKTEIIGDVICTKGDINVGSGDNSGTKAEINIHGTTIKPELWFDSIKTVKGSDNPKININADTFVLNDIELNADKSEVIVKGNYYGYDDGTLKKTKDDEGNALIDIIYSSLIDREKAHSDSSAVIINGNESALTMKDIDTFVLMGKAYIEPGDEEIETAEGVALKTNQQLYLVPTDFLNKANPLGVANPSSSNTYFAPADINIPEEWFGTKYLIEDGEVTETLEDGSTATRKNYMIEEVAVPDKDAVYAFLKFNENDFYETLVEKTTIYNGESITVPAHTVIDSSKSYKIGTDVVCSYGDTEISAPFTARTGYIKEIMGGFDGGRKPTAAQLRKRVNLSISNEKPGAFHLDKCVIMEDGVARSSSVENIYSKNAAVSYFKGTPAPTVTPGVTETPADPPAEGEPTATPTPEEIPEEELHFTIKTISNTASQSRYTAYPQNLFFRYKWLCASLKSWDSVPISGEIKDEPEDKIKDASGNSFSWQINSDFPFIKYVDMGHTKANVDNTKNDETSDVGKLYVLSGGRGSGTPAVLDKPDASNPNVYGFVICDGDLVVKAGVNVFGTIIAKGTVTFEGNNLVKTDRALIQRRIDDEISKVRKTGYYRDDYLISYLIDSDYNLMYDINKANESKLIDKDKLNYTDYVFFDNWQKGGR